MRRGVTIALAYVILFYVATPLWFCVIVEDRGICPHKNNLGAPFSGVISSLYFASTTISTVGVSHEGNGFVFQLLYAIFCL